MIRAMIFDLDGTLVKTERLKAISYAKAAVELCQNSLQEETVIEAFKDVVGLSRHEVAKTLVDRFKLSELASERMTEFGVNTPWQAYIQVRLQIYEAMLDDPNIIKNNQWEHNMAVLRFAKDHGCKTALATMSYCPQVNRVLNILEIKDHFDFIATREDVERGKPSPQIYNLVMEELGVQPHECIALEDSPSGAKSALRAGVRVIGVSTPFTREKLHRVDGLEKEWIVNNPKDVMATVKRAFELASV